MMGGNGSTKRIDLEPIPSLQQKGVQTRKIATEIEGGNRCVSTRGKVLAAQALGTHTEIAKAAWTILSPALPVIAREGIFMTMTVMEEDVVGRKARAKAKAKRKGSLLGTPEKRKDRKEGAEGAANLEDEDETHRAGQKAGPQQKARASRGCSSSACHRR
mmetsp:Transcript_90606/g.189483  ORF Transcript_90606/g.189483 Transcript_90606/m.189483 type:complete len:160 (-) Transcript_90606:233-712(-)